MTQNVERNRFQDVVPYDENRVKINNEKVSNLTFFKFAVTNKIVWVKFQDVKGRREKKTFLRTCLARLLGTSEKNFAVVFWLLFR